MLKKILSVVLSIAMTFTLFACGSNSSISSDGSSSGGSASGGSNSDLRSQIENLNSLTDTIKFGSDGSHEPIEWFILEDNGEKVLLLSKYVLTNKKYYDENDSIEDLRVETWENSSLRKFLNSEFISSRFSKKEQKYILDTDIVNTIEYVDGKEQFGNTKDKVFLLNREEVEKYIYKRSDVDWGKETIPELMAYVKNGDSTAWWLRGTKILWYVERNGKIFLESEEDSNYGVRPAMWVKY